MGEKLALVAKISDPAKKQERSGAIEEGREIHVTNFPWKTTEGDLVELFTAYGNVESARIPTKADGSSKGFGFVAFTTKVGLHSVFFLCVCLKSKNTYKQPIGCSNRGPGDGRQRLSFSPAQRPTICSYGC